MLDSEPYKTPWVFIFGAFMLGGFCVALIHDPVPSGGFANWLKEWEVLLGAGAAIVAAVLGGWFIRSSDERKRSARARAERAMLPHYLSGLKDHADKSVELLVWLLEQVNLRSSERSPYPEGLPSLESWILEGIKDNIEFANSQIAEDLGAFLAELHYMNALLEGQYDRIIRPYRLSRRRIETAENVAHCIYQVGKCLAWAGKFYGYATNDNTIRVTPPSSSEIEVSLSLSGISVELYPDLRRLVERRRRN